MLAENQGLESNEQDGTMREDLQLTLDKSHINPAQLNRFQRILLTTDGTVTDILEAYLFEQMRIVKLGEEISATEAPIPFMNLESGTEVLKREVLLQGKISRKNFIYANSVIVPDRLDDGFKNALMETKMPIGKIWIELRVETFKEIKESSLENALNLSKYFNINPDDKLLSRTYCVYSRKKAVMMITEKFPESYFHQ
jgi:chorismate-pyruvate lyase